MKIIVLDKQTSAIQVILSQMRDKKLQQERRNFTSNVENLGTILAYEASKYIDYRNVDIHTPYHITQGNCFQDRIVLYVPLRAGIPLLNGIQRILIDSDCAFMGGRHLHSQKPDIDFVSAPDINGTTLIIADTLIASGGTIINAMKAISDYGIPHRIIILSVISTNTAINALEDNLPKGAIFITCEVDKFTPGILGTDPGIGDIGDLLYGRKLKV